MQDHTADDLHAVVLHAEHTLRCLTHGRISLRQQIVKRLSAFQPLLEFLCLVL